MKRQDISRLRRNYARHFQIGLILSISLITLAFQWTIQPPDYSDATVAASLEEPDVQIVRTVYEKPPQLPPPAIHPTETIIETEVEFVEEPLPEKIETVVTALPPNEDTFPEPTRASTPPKAPPLPEEPKVDVPPIVLVAEEMPRFQGCEEMDLAKEERKKCAEEQMLKFIYSHVKYPQLAKEIGLEGTVVARFIIETDGSVSAPQIVKDIGAGCGKEVMRLVKRMPRWIPGKQNGRKVRVQFNLPVQFRLK